MKYFSEDLNKYFDTEKECIEAEESAAKAKADAEAKAKELKAERKARAQEVEDALKTLKEAQKAYRDLVHKFVKDYGSYHYSYTDSGKGILDDFFTFWF
jgi:F0F1-type ATP synthase membrane subunit b/b'